MDDKLIENVAKAIAKVTADWPWSLWTDEARAAIEAVRAWDDAVRKAEHMKGANARAWHMT